MAESRYTSPFAVLVVEDEPLLLMDAMDMVEDAGLVAYGAGNATEAIALLEKHPEVRILFTDVDMPGPMDGLTLAHTVRSRWPAISIIVASGHVRISPDELPENGLFFAKPYPPVAIVAALGDLAATMAP